MKYYCVGDLIKLKNSYQTSENQATILRGWIIIEGRISETLFGSKFAYASGWQSMWLDPGVIYPHMEHCLHDVRSHFKKYEWTEISRTKLQGFQNLQ